MVPLHFKGKWRGSGSLKRINHKKCFKLSFKLFLTKPIWKFQTLFLRSTESVVDSVVCSLSPSLSDRWLGFVSWRLAVLWWWVWYGYFAWWVYGGVVYWVYDFFFLAVGLLVVVWCVVQWWWSGGVVGVSFFALIFCGRYCGWWWLLLICGWFFVVGCVGLMVVGMGSLCKNDIKSEGWNWIVIFGLRKIPNSTMDAAMSATNFQVRTKCNLSFFLLVFEFFYWFR